MDLQGFDDQDPDLWMQQVDDEQQNRLLDDADRISFEDSERFEEESSSWQSLESLNLAQQNWRGWTGDSLKVNEDEVDNQPGPSNRLLLVSGRHSAASSTHTLTRPHSSHHQHHKASRINPLRSFAAMACAQHLSFESIQEKYQTLFMQNIENPNSIYKTSMLPEDYFMEIVQYCFPRNEEDIRLYSCLANRNGDEFSSGELLVKENCVHDVIQIGFHLSGLVRGKVTFDEQTGNLSFGHNKDEHRVSAKIDRCRIVELECNCDSKSQWCQHSVALCLFRMHRIENVEFRAPLSESISTLKSNRLRVFISHLLDKLPRQYLPTAQILLDDLGKLSDEEINAHLLVDPTVSAHSDKAFWVFNEEALREDVRRSINKFCIPSPQVHSDCETMSSPQTIVAQEFSSLLRSFMSREPEALWNLLSIVREMYRRRDEKATTLLHIITEQCLLSEPMCIWWYTSKLVQTGRWVFFGSAKSGNSVISGQHALQYNCSALFDEIIRLWRCAALNPVLTPHERNSLITYLQDSHRTACENIWKILPKNFPTDGEFQRHQWMVCWVVDEKGNKLLPEAARFTRAVFPGFYDALEACQVSWNGCLVDGVEISHHTAFDRSPSVSLEGDDEASNFPTLPFLNQKRQPATLNTFPSGPSPFGNYYHTFEYMAKDKKKKKKSRTMGRGIGGRGHRYVQHPCQPLPEFYDPRTLRRATRVAARRAAQLAPSQDAGDESTESGQESDLPQNLATLPPITPRDKLGSFSQNAQFPQEDIELLLASAHESLEGLELKFARCEALYVHGYEKEGLTSALELIQYLRASPPDLSLPTSLINYLGKQSERGKRNDETNNWDPKKRRNFGGPSRTEAIPVPPQCSPLVKDAKLLEVSERTINTYERVAFLAKLFIHDPSHHSMLFSFLLFLLELPQTPMANKYLQVKLFHLESELLTLLRGIEIGTCELTMVRERASRLCNRINRPSLFFPSIGLCHFIFDALSYTTNMFPNGTNGPVCTTAKTVGRKPNDDVIALKIALEALGSRQTFSEDDCPMLAETTRRQKACLASSLMLCYKDSNEMLGHVLDKLLDPRIHLMYNEMRHQSNACYFLEQDPAYQKYCQRGARSHYPYRPEEIEFLTAETMQPAGPALVSRSASCQSAESTGEFPSGSDGQSADDEAEQLSKGLGQMMIAHPTAPAAVLDRQTESASESVDRNSPQASICSSTAPPSVGSSLCAEPTDTDDSANISLDLFKKRSKWNALYAYGSGRPSEATAQHYMDLAKRLAQDAGSSSRTEPHHWNPHPNNQQQGINRKLQIAGFIIGLYALGLNNLVNSHWPTRTYSTYVSWLKIQIEELGGPAFEILRHTWRKHLIPAEVAEVVLKPGYSRDTATLNQATYLAVDALHSADAISTQNCTQLLLHCKEHGPTFLEQACRAVERASGSGDGVAPEILFLVARYWHELYKENDATAGPSCSQQMLPPQPQQQQQQQQQMAIPPLMQQQQYHHQAQQQRQQHMPKPQSVHMNYMRPNNFEPQMPFGFHPSMPPPTQPQPHFMGQPHHAQRPHTIYLHPQQFQPYPMMPMPGNNVDATGRMPPPSIHQSHSAPSLLPGQVPQQLDPNVHQNPAQMPYFNMPNESTLEKLMNAYNMGMKALDTMGKREQDDRHYQKYSETPSMKEDIMWLQRVAFDLDQLIRTQQPAAYSIDFYRMAIQSVASPFVLFELAERSTELRSLMGGHPQSGMIYPPRPPPMVPLTHNKYKHLSPGSVRQAFTSVGLLMITGELVEQAIEAFHTALFCKVTHPRMGDSQKNDANHLVARASKCIQWIPIQPLRQQVYEGFIRHIKQQTKNGELKKQLIQAMNGPIN